MGLEIWALHEKIGKQPWKLAEWFTPLTRAVGDESAEAYAKGAAKYLTERSENRGNRKYKAIRYAPIAARIRKLKE